MVPYYLSRSNKLCQAYLYNNIPCLLEAPSISSVNIVHHICFTCRCTSYKARWPAHWSCFLLQTVQFKYIYLVSSLFGYFHVFSDFFTVYYYCCIINILVFSVYICISFKRFAILAFLVETLALLQSTLHFPHSIFAISCLKYLHTLQVCIYYYTSFVVYQDNNSTIPIARITNIFSSMSVSQMPLF